MNLLKTIIIGFTVLLVVILAAYINNHYTNSSIIQRGTIELKEHQSDFEKLIRFCESQTDSVYSIAHISFRKGWDSVQVDLFKTDTQEEIHKNLVVPFDIQFLLFGSNAFDLKYKKNECLIIEYPYSNYSLNRTSLVYAYRLSELLKTKYQQLSRYDDISQIKNEELIYLVDENWFILIN